MERVIKFLNENPIFFIATVEGDQPRVRPFGVFIEHNGKLCLCSGDKKSFYQQLQANPKLEITTCSKDGSKWIRIQAKAGFTANCPEVHEKVFAKAPHLRNIYPADGSGISGNFFTFSLDDAVATLYSMTGAPETIKF